VAKTTLVDHCELFAKVVDANRHHQLRDTALRDGLNDKRHTSRGGHCVLPRRNRKPRRWRRSKLPRCCKSSNIPRSSLNTGRHRSCHKHDGVGIFCSVPLHKGNVTATSPRDGNPRDGLCLCVCACIHLYRHGVLGQSDKRERMFAPCLALNWLAEKMVADLTSKGPT
jgi:hypothetical protein